MPPTGAVTFNLAVTGLLLSLVSNGAGLIGGQSVRFPRNK